MAYLEISKEAYNDIIIAAGMRAAQVAKVCEAQGVWSAEAAAEEPVVTEEVHVPATTYAPEPEIIDDDPIMESSDD